MDHHVHNHTHLYIGLAFAAGILLTLGYKDVYPDLERRFRRAVNSRNSPTISHQHPHPSTHIDLADRTKPSHTSHDETLQSTTTPYIIRDGIEATIGNTPLIRIKSLSDATGCDILAKAEFLNGAGNSPKDRVALSMIQLAEESNLLTPNSGDTIYEGTVGSTGISLAAICRAKGYTAHICMPNDQSTEKTHLLLRLGATVERVPPAPIVSPSQFVNLARSRAAAHSDSPETTTRGFFADQFENPANHLAHFSSTGPEIYFQTSGNLDAFVAGAGTGGTISGVAMFLKPRLPALKVVLADPNGSGLYHRVKHGVMFANTEREGTRRRHQVDSVVEGIGVNRVTANFEAGRELVDDAVRVTDEQAMRMGRWLVERDGLFVGSSSCVNVVAAVKVALGLGKGSRVVTILCDSGTRHLSKFWKQAGEVGGDDEVSLESIFGHDWLKT